MAKVLVTESYLEDIGDAIRAKLETQDTYTPSEMADAIGQISGGATLISKTITQNGTYNAADESADGYSSVVVDVAGGGSTTYVGTTDPSQSQGHIGDFYIKYVQPGESSMVIGATYVKVGASEQTAEWVEAPIVVFLDNSESVENLYANGTFYESFAPFSAQSNNQTFTVNTNSLEFTRVAHGNTGFIYYTANKIDLTDVKEIVMNASVSFGYEHKDDNYYPHLGVFSAVSSWSSYTMVSETPIHEGIDSTMLDVSNLSGEYYVGIYGYALTATVSQIFLHKETNIA